MDRHYLVSDILGSIKQRTSLLTEAENSPGVIEESSTRGGVHDIIAL